MKSLQKRMKTRDLIVLKTDKSGKLCVISSEEYLKMGEEHTKKDMEVDRKTIIDKEKQLNGHVFFWSKIWGSGESHGHKGRIIDSKVVSSEQLAEMYCMFKDHKEGKKSRPVVTGCNSNTRGFSNSVSDLLESVNKANLDPYESISSEDMLAKINKYNKKAEEIMKEGREKLQQKLRCSKKDGIKIISCCDKLWDKKSEEARRKSCMEKDGPESGTGIGGGAEVPPVGGLIQGGEEDGRQPEPEPDCGQEKGEEILKYRRHQYKENPSMNIT